MSNSEILKIESLLVSFDGNTVIDNLSFSVRKGEITAIVGPNGAGKSVLFRALMGLIDYEGKIQWSPSDLKISYVPQRFSIEKDFPLTVKEFFKLKSKNINDAMFALESVGLKNKDDNSHHVEHHLLNQRLGWLSGGQIQRVLIAWAIMNKPDVLLFDEPTSGIDIGGEETIYNLLKKLNAETNLTILLISHDLNIVYKYANNVLCLNKEKLCFGPPKNVLDPESLANLYGGETSFYAHNHNN